MTFSNQDEDRDLREAFDGVRERDRSSAPVFSSCLREPGKATITRGVRRPWRRLMVGAAALVVAAVVWIAVPQRIPRPVIVETAVTETPTQFLLEADYGWKDLGELQLADWAGPTDFLLAFAEDEPPAGADA